MAITTSLWGQATIPGFLYAKVASEAITRSNLWSPSALREPVFLRPVSPGNMHPRECLSDPSCKRYQVQVSKGVMALRRDFPDASLEVRERFCPDPANRDRHPPQALRGAKPSAPLLPKLV